MSKEKKEIKKPKEIKTDYPSEVSPKDRPNEGGKSPKEIPTRIPPEVPGLPII